MLAFVQSIRRKEKTNRNFDIIKVDVLNKENTIKIRIDIGTAG